MTDPNQTTPQITLSTLHTELPVMRSDLFLVEKALELGVTIYPSEVPELIVEVQARAARTQRIRSRSL